MTIRSCGTNALLRTLRGGDDALLLTEPLAQPCALVLWWGPAVTVPAGARVAYFPTPWGPALESVRFPDAAPEA